MKSLKYTYKYKFLNFFFFEVVKENKELPVLVPDVKDKISTDA